MPPQRRTAQGFAGAAVKIDLIRKGIMTRCAGLPQHCDGPQCENRPDS